MFLLQCWCFVKQNKKKKAIYHCSHLIIVMSPYQMDLAPTADTICADLWGGGALVNAPIRSKLNYHSGYMGVVFKKDSIAPPPPPPPWTISIMYTIISSFSHLSFGVLMTIIVIIAGFVTSKRRGAVQITSRVVASHPYSRRWLKKKSHRGL